MKNPLIDQRQKFAAGTEVYIRPIFESSMTHFNCDVITTIEGTYAQLFGGEDFDSYSTKIAAWYHECQLMPTQGYGIDSCRFMCEEYFGESHKSMMDRRIQVIENCPFNKSFRKMVDEEMAKLGDKIIMDFQKMDINT